MARRVKRVSLDLPSRLRPRIIDEGKLCDTQSESQRRRSAVCQSLAIDLVELDSIHDHLELLHLLCRNLQLVIDLLSFSIDPYPRVTHPQEILQKCL